MAAAFLLASSFLLAIKFYNANKEKEELDGYDQYINILKREFSADVMYYGDDPCFRKNLTVRKIDKISHETLFEKQDSGYRALVLWDKDDTLKISDEDLKLIKNEVEENGLDMFYIGKSYLDDFCRLGFSAAISDNEKSLEYIGSINVGKKIQQNEIGNLYAAHGLWRDEDEARLLNNPEDLQYRIVMLMKDYATGELSWHEKEIAENSYNVSNIKFGSRNIEIVSWEKNGFIGKECSTGDLVMVNLVIENGRIEQSDGSIYPECRYGIEPGDTRSEEYIKSRLNDNWFLSAYGEWEEKQYNIGDIVYVSCFNEAVFYDKDGMKMIDALGLSPELKFDEVAE